MDDQGRWRGPARAGKPCAMTGRVAAAIAIVLSGVLPAAAADAPAASPAPCPSPAAIVDRIQRRYDTTSAFRAEFRQETFVKAVGDVQEARGIVAFKKHGRMRWDFRTPVEQLMVADGTTLWIYQPADKQVLRAPFKAAFVSTTPVSFLLGVGRITENFTPEPDPRGCSAERLHVRLAPKTGTDVGGLALGVDAKTDDIVEAAVTDPLGNVTTLGFSALERNADVSDDEFRFVPPKGVDVVDAPGTAAAPPPQ